MLRLLLGAAVLTCGLRVLHRNHPAIPALGFWASLAVVVGLAVLHAVARRHMDRPRPIRMDARR